MARLDQRFKLLTGGSRAALERHQTLRSTIDWSYDLLEPTEQKALDRLSVFAGGCDLQRRGGGAGRRRPGRAGRRRHVGSSRRQVAGHRRHRRRRLACATGCSRASASTPGSASKPAATPRRCVAATPTTTSGSQRPPPRTCVPRTSSRGPRRWPGTPTTFRVVLDWAIETASVEHVCRMIAPFTVQGLPIAYLAMDWAQTAIAHPGWRGRPSLRGGRRLGRLGRDHGQRPGPGRRLHRRRGTGPGRSGAPDPLLLRSRAVAAYFGGDVDRGDRGGPKPG